MQVKHKITGNTVAPASVSFWHLGETNDGDVICSGGESQPATGGLKTPSAETKGETRGKVDLRNGQQLTKDHTWVTLFMVVRQLTAQAVVARWHKMFKGHFDTDDVAIENISWGTWKEIISKSKSNFTGTLWPTPDSNSPLFPCSWNHYSHKQRQWK